MNLLAYLPFFPLVSFLLLIAFAKRLSWRLASILSVGSVGLSALASFYLVANLPLSTSGTIQVTLWHWFDLAGTAVNFAFTLDALSAVMICVVSGIGFLIHLFAAAYMRDDENFTRFMAYMNLFIVAMLILVLADNLVLLYLGWEGVGLCSFLLIGFWYQDKANMLAARKAFIVTRIGDTALAIGLFILFTHIGELAFNPIADKVASHWQVGNDTAFWVALFILGGAVGKSAQLPLQTWLPDAMAGPTPVSALIHAATMVTAGVYLIARMNSVFLLAPEVMQLVSWVGAITLVMAGICALKQTDIKRILAYSTMSQIGYMMLALGAGAWSAGVFHLMTHAFFKALLFLTAGAIILVLHHQQDIFKMGGLLKRLPIESGLFIVGLICLVALPGSSGFFSKEAIIGALWSSETAGPSLWLMAIIGALLTSIYSCRLFFLAFLGNYRGDSEIHLDNVLMMRVALIVLALLSVVGGFITVDISSILSGEINARNTTQQLINEPNWLHSVAIATPFLGIIFSWFYFSQYRASGYNKVIYYQPSKFSLIAKEGLGFDWLYHQLFVRPFCFIAQLNRRDLVDQIVMATAWYCKLAHDSLSALQTGHLRWYATTIGISMLALLLIWLGA